MCLAACWPGRVQAVLWSPTTVVRAPSDRPSLGWSDDRAHARSEMILVCSACGTRWNVRDRRRVWCPRCHGTLLAPSGPALGAEWSARPTAPSLGSGGLGSPPSGGGHTPARLPTGYRWIAVRPGAAPPPRRLRRPLGPTPRYGVIPRCGLIDDFEAPELHTAGGRRGPSLAAVRTTLIATMVVLGVAALVQ